MLKGFCDGSMNAVFWLAVAFLAAALVLGAWSAIKALSGPGGSTSVTTIGANTAQIGPILEALKGLIEALGKAPAWFALFLAGIFLFWLAGETYVEACKPAVAKSSVITKTSTTLIEKTVQKKI